MGFQRRFYNLGKLGKYTVFYIKFKEILRLFLLQIYVFKKYSISSVNNRFEENNLKYIIIKK